MCSYESHIEMISKLQNIGKSFFVCTVIPRLMRSLRARILGMLSFEDVQNDSRCAF